MDILLVEDNPGDVRHIREAFETTDFETRVHVAINGKDALEFLRERIEDETVSRPLDYLLRGERGLNMNMYESKQGAQGR